jgi:hypothetical protein
MDQGTLPPEMEARLPRLKGETINLQQDEGYVDLLIGADNSRWLPAYVGSSEFPFDNLRLMMSSFGERYILMGSPGKQTGACPRVDVEGNWQNAIRDLGSATNTGARFRGVMRPCHHRRDSWEPQRRRMCRRVPIGQPHRRRRLEDLRGTHRQWPTREASGERHHWRQEPPQAAIHR